MKKLLFLISFFILNVLFYPVLIAGIDLGNIDFDERATAIENRLKKNQRDATIKALGELFRLLEVILESFNSISQDEYFSMSEESGRLSQLGAFYNRTLPLLNQLENSNDTIKCVSAIYLFDLFWDKELNGIASNLGLKSTTYLEVIRVLTASLGRAISKKQKREAAGRLIVAAETSPSFLNQTDLFLQIRGQEHRIGPLITKAQNSARRVLKIPKAQNRRKDTTRLSGANMEAAEVPEMDPTERTPVRRAKIKRRQEPMFMKLGPALWGKACAALNWLNRFI